MGCSRKLFITDTQLHHWKRFGLSEDNPALTKLTEAQIKALEQVLGIVDATQVQSVEHGGDVFQQRGMIPVVAINIADKFFNKELKAKRGIPTFLTGGNHDQLDDEVYNEFGDALNFLKHDTDFKDSFSVCRVPYWEPVDYTAIKGYDMVVLHKEAVGAKDGKYDCEIGVDWETLARNNRSVWFGHIHTRQLMSPNCFIGGDFIQLSFGETTDKGVWLIEKLDEQGTAAEFYSGDIKATEEYFVDPKFKVSFFELDFPKFITVEKSEALPEKEVRGNDFYRVTEAAEKVDDDNVLAAPKTVVYEERITSNDVLGTITEWASAMGKGAEYVSVGRKLVEDNTVMIPPVFDGVLESVHLKDFLSHEDSFVEFQKGWHCLYGVKGTFGGSNGVGKSTICEAVAWAFFNSLTKDQQQKEEVIRDKPTKQKEAVVEVIVRKQDGNRLKVKRSTKTGLSVIACDENGIEIGDDLVGHMNAKIRQEYLEKDILGFNLDLFMSAVYFSQDNLKMITGMKKTEKTNMIMGLLGFHQYDALYDVVSKMIKTESDKLMQFERLVENIDIKIESTKGPLIDATNELVVLSGKEKELPSIDELAHNLQLLKDVHAEKKGVLDSLEMPSEVPMIQPNVIEKSDITELETQKQQYLSACENVKQKMMAIERQREEDLALNRQKIFEISKGLGVVEAKKQQAGKISTEIERLKIQPKGGFCKSCGSEITEQSADGCIKALESDLISLKKDIEESEMAITKERQILVDQEAEIRKVVGQRLQLGEVRLEENESLLKEVNRKIEEAQMEYVSKLQQESNRVSMLNTAIIAGNKAGRELWTQKRKEMQIEVDQYFEQVKIAANKHAMAVVAHKNIADNKQAVNSRIDRLQKTMIDLEAEKSDILKKGEGLKTKMDILEFWKQAFSTTGIRASLLSKFCNSFNTLVGEYAIDVGGGVFGIYVEPMKELASGEVRNELDIKVSVGDVVRRFAMYSGGEKRRIDICLCLALNKWVAKQHNLKNGLLGLLVLDELFSYLDSVGEETTALVLQRESVDKCVLVVSHTPELKSYASREIKVYKDENEISRVVVTDGKSVDVCG